MNLRKGGSAACIIGLSIFCCFFLFATAASAAIILKSERFTLILPEDPASSIPFQIVEPGKVIIEVTTAEPLGRLGIIARGYYPNAVPKRKDGPTPLRIEFKVTAADIQKGVRTWHAFPTVMAPNKSLYNSSGKAITGEVKVSFVPDRPASGTTQSGAPPPSSAGTATGKSTSTTPPPASAGSATGKTSTTSQPPASAGTATGKSATTSRPPAPPPAGAATAPIQTSRMQAAPLQGKTLSKVGQAPATTQVRLPNPSGFTATPGAGGTVTLKWNTVPNAIYYNLQGPGVQPVSGMPPNVQGTTYTVKGLPAGNYQWALFAVYSGPSGPHFGDESNPARVSAAVSGPKAGWYAYYLTGFEVQQQTYDHMLNADGWGDEVFITMDVVETGPVGAPVQKASGRLPAVGNFGDVGKAENRVRAGTASSNGGLKNADIYHGTPFPYRVWCGQLVEGETAVVITSTIWEWDGGEEGFYKWMAFIAKHNRDLQHKDVAAAGTAMNPAFGTYMQAGAKLTEMGAQGLLEMKEVLGGAKDRPIGMAQDGSFEPRASILTYQTAENALSRAWFGPVGTFSIKYQEPPGSLNGWYTLKGRIERVAGPDVCRQWP